MKRFANVGFLTSSAAVVLFAAASIALYGCVTEEIPPPEIHTSAYVVPDSDSDATGDLPARSNETVATGATAPTNSSKTTSTSVAPTAPLPAVVLPPPPIGALPPPPPVSIP
ncbi:MAG TPA: hypothetical protein VN867_12810 [Candidatus Binataceae bacterium]|nr:hypothetical protein [Candidatus Binataceae bacterium]